MKIVIIPYIIKGCRNAEVPWSKILWFYISQPSKTGGDSALWPFSIIPNPTPINLSSYTGLSCEQEPAFSAVASTIHGHKQTVSSVLKKNFAVPYSTLKSVYFWPLRSQGSSLQSSAEKFKTDKHQQEHLLSEMRNSGVFQYWMVFWKAHIVQHYLQKRAGLLGWP